MEFLKKHYEKIVLCVVLLGLAGAVLWMKSATAKVKFAVEGPVGGPPPRTAPPQPLDLSNDQQALAQITNPPPVVLSGAHNLFNPVTWKRKANGDLLKVLLTGPDALMVTNIVPLYMIVSFESTIGGSSSNDLPTYVMGIQRNIDLRQPVGRVHKEYLKKDETKKSLPFIVRGTKGAETDPSEINLEMTDTGDTNVWVSTNSPYKRVESYYADLKYDPESLILLKKKVNDEIKLDNEMYKIVEITNGFVRVQSEKITKVTEIKWTKSP